MARPSSHAVVVSALVAAGALVGFTPARAETFTGEVVAAHGRRSDDGRSIVTDVTLRLPDGTERVVTQLGGHFDGKTMVVSHGPEPLVTGLRVRVTARPERVATRWSVEDVAVLAGPGGVPFVRTPAKKSGRPLYWAKSCVQVSWATEGTSDIPGDEERAVIEAVIAAWNDGMAGCSHMNLVGMGAVDAEVGEDQVNLIKFRDTTWCRPKVGDEAPRCHAAEAAGVTTSVYIDDPDHPRDGEIVDADIELNAVDLAISIRGQTQSNEPCRADLANTLTHELGHLLGLDHSCRKDNDPPRVDDAGAAVPFCTDTRDPEILEATMYPEQVCGETKKASLAADDLAAMCAIYPSADDPGVCEAPDDTSGGCCSSGGGGGGTAAPLTIALALLIGGRRRRRPR